MSNVKTYDLARKEICERVWPVSVLKQPLLILIRRSTVRCNLTGVNALSSPYIYCVAKKTTEISHNFRTDLGQNIIFFFFLIFCAVTVRPTTLSQYISYIWLSQYISYICHVRHHMTLTIDKMHYHVLKPQREDKTKKKVI